MRILRAAMCFVLAAGACNGTMDGESEADRGDLAPGVRVEAMDSEFDQLGRAVGMTIAEVDLRDDGDGTFRMSHLRYEHRLNREALQSGRNDTVCPDEPFIGQPSAGGCSAFLIADNVIASAGHCFPSGPTPSTCEHARVVFDYRLTPDTADGSDANRLALTRIPKHSVYRCVRFLRHEFDRDQDFAVMEIEPLGADPSPREPLELGPRPGEGDPLFALGHPYGLPTKATSGVAAAQTDHFVRTNLLLSPKNSGGPILDANGRVVAIGIRGPFEQFESDGDCFRISGCGPALPQFEFDPVTGTLVPVTSPCQGIFQQSVEPLVPFAQAGSDDPGTMCSEQPGVDVGRCCEFAGSPGVCIDATTTTCDGTLAIGACPGPANVRCCASP